MPDAALPNDTATARPRRSWKRAFGVLAMPVVLAGLITAGTPGWTSVVVHRGDTLSDIAKRYHTSVTRLESANDLPGNGHLIYAGERLRVPTAATQAKIAKARASKARHTKARTTKARTTKATSSRRTHRTSYVVHRVRAGDSLIKIARKYGARTSAIRLTNHLPVTGVVQLGRALRIPVSTRASSGSTTAGRRRATSTTSATRRPSKANTFAGRTYPQSIVNRASANRSYLAHRSMPSRSEMRRIIRDAARRNGVSPSLALAVAYQESGFNPRVVSVANAIGAMQVIPATGEWASSIVGRRLDLLNPRDNALAGVILLRVLTRTASSTEHAVAGYYQGLASVRRNGMYSDTRRYVANVMSLRSGF